ncbi:hypothetical protein NM688_g5619 [Phlebia brevispora]|uniref:Uncharacterized protein n=1 Tax=Phlebia brevispora TaxID=194682 RepID=A0ACC1SSL9_9APHY|nr:hypothetical protein NM688_g5619 [Phlebia brevispora]
MRTRSIGSVQSYLPSVSELAVVFDLIRIPPHPPKAFPMSGNTRYVKVGMDQLLKNVSISEDIADERQL